jgi:integrase
MQANRNPTAQMVWEAASNVMTFAVRHGYRDDNPLIRIKPEFKKTARERVLNFEEIREVWLATNALSEVHKAAVRLLMLLPFRKTEFLGSNWDEVQNDWINIPPNRTKNTDATSLFISSFAQSHLPSRQNTSDLIFTTDGVVPTRLGSKILNKLRMEANIPHWQIHDFRRTFSTHMHEVNSAHHIIEACLNHRDGTRQGVSGVYNRAEYRDQKQIILQQWSDIVEAAVVRG